MFFILRKSVRRLQHCGWSARLVPAMSVLLAACGLAAPSALATGTPFQRGDVLASVGGGINVYAPTGVLKGSFATGSGAASLCFDPSGKHLILPGVGLFDSSGNLLPSSWASVTHDGRCRADGFGNVYVVGLGWTVTKYHIDGTPVRTYNLASLPSISGIAGMDFAPDECTMYYGSWDGLFGAIGRFNVCENVQAATFTNGFPTDDLRVLPNWQVLATDDPAAVLFDASGSEMRTYWPGGVPNANGNTLRSLILDSDGTSFWLCCTYTAADPTTVFKIFRFDIGSGQLLASWPLGSYGTPIATYAPPLVGDANVNSTIDSNSAGTAEAFLTKAPYSGQMSRLRLYVDSSSTASQVVVGIYSNRNGDPGALQTQATITNLRAGSWNYVDIPSMLPVTSGRRYWIAVLGPSGSGKIRFRDAASGAGSETSAQHNLIALPRRWSTGKTWATGNVSAYGG